MAIPIPKKEFLDKIEEMLKAVQGMPDTAKICPVCFSLFSEKDLDHYSTRVCWCDYDSPAMGDYD